MKINKIHDTEINNIVNTNYDIAFFASGYESRCTYISTLLDKDSVNTIVVLGFKNIANNTQRKLNDGIFSEKFNIEPFLIPSNDDCQIYNKLNELIDEFQHQDKIRILVDYSSMSRMWYAAIINWSLYNSKFSTIIIDFVYSHGLYKEYIPPMVIKDIMTIPGCDGSGIKHSSSIAIFGLGFYSLAMACVLERLESDTVYAFYSQISENYNARVEKDNKDTINDFIKNPPLKLPINSIETSYRYLAELIAPYLDQKEVIFIPMGPKPHILTCILLSRRFRNITCLRVSAEDPPHKPLDIAPSGEIYATQIELTI